MNSVNLGNAIDEGDLEDELEALQQEQLDEQMLKTGTVPVSDAVQRLPAAANGERKKAAASRARPRLVPHANIYDISSQQEDPYCRGRRRRRRAQEAPGGNGHVDRYPLIYEARECRILGSLGRRGGGICFRPSSDRMVGHLHGSFSCSLRRFWSVTTRAWSCFWFISHTIYCNSLFFSLALVVRTWRRRPTGILCSMRQIAEEAALLIDYFTNMSMIKAHCIPISRPGRAGELRVRVCFFLKSRGETRAFRGATFLLVGKEPDFLACAALKCWPLYASLVVHDTVREMPERQYFMVLADFLGSGSYVFCRLKTIA